MTLIREQNEGVPPGHAAVVTAKPMSNAPNATATLSATSSAKSRRRNATWRKIAAVNRELWLLLAIFAIAYLLNSLVTENRMLLYLYVIPTMVSAYFYGRRHAVLTAFSSIFLIVFLEYVNPNMLKHGHSQLTMEENVGEFVLWGGILVVIAYFMGTLYERVQENMRDLRQSYDGMLTMLQHIASDNKYSQNHPHRVSLMAAKIADQMELGTQRSEDVRRSALLHEIEKVGITREMLFQAANFKEEEIKQMQADLRLAVMLKDLPGRLFGLLCGLREYRFRPA